MDEDALRGPDRAPWRTDTAERPAVVVPPEPAQPIAPVLPRVPTGPPGPPRGPRDRQRDPAPAWIAWVVVAAVLVVAAVVGVRLVLQPPDESSTAVDPTPARERQTANQQPRASETPDDGSAGVTDEGDAGEDGEEEGGGDTGAPPEIVTLGGLPTVTVPGAAPANNDVTGERVTFVGENMLDADPATCWRVAGAPASRVVTFTFPDEVTITQVALVNGYAKTSTDSAGRSFDWYLGNRRLTQVEWIVGGQTFPQALVESRTLQALEIAPTPTTEIQLRLVAASPPGPPPIGRDYTAISDIEFSGYAD